MTAKDRETVKELERIASSGELQTADALEGLSKLAAIAYRETGLKKWQRVAVSSQAMAEAVREGATNQEAQLRGLEAIREEEGGCDQ